MKIVKKKVAKGPDNKRIPYTIRTIVRRPTASTLSPTSTKSSLEVTSSRTGSGFVIRKGRPLDGPGKRVRLRDSLLARVQGKFRARSTTAKPDAAENGSENDSTDHPKPKVPF